MLVSVRGFIGRLSCSCSSTAQDGVGVRLSQIVGEELRLLGSVAEFVEGETFRIR